ncbi:MAG: amino acid permease [Bianqueaceae bacterium]
MAETQKEQVQNLKQDSIGKLDVIIMSVSAAAPAMCLGGSFGTIMQGAGSAVALAFLLATAVIVMIGLNYGQLSSRYNSAGGTYSYVRSVFGEKAGFVSGWIYMGVNICTGVIGAIFATYLHELFPAIPLWAGVLILLVPIFSWDGTASR